MNPLLEIQFRFPFDKVAPVEVEPAIDALLADAAQRLEQAATSDDPLLALDVMTEKLDFAQSVVRHLESVFLISSPASLKTYPTGVGK